MSEVGLVMAFVGPITFLVLALLAVVGGLLLLRLLFAVTWRIFLVGILLVVFVWAIRALGPETATFGLA